MIEVKKLASTHKRYSSGMRYSLSISDGSIGTIFFTELAFLELKNKILTAVQQQLPGFESNDSTPKPLKG
jgi:hypothetical protein